LESNIVVHEGDCRDILKTLPTNSVDSAATDPPYELKFMGKKWDNTGIAYDTSMWAEVLRVLKPGGHLLAFGGTRTYHRMVVAIEDAGFEIRDSIHWIYGSGFPKSLNVGKQDGCEAWDGWGTALKPAHEPIVVARKPLNGTVAANVLQHGTGAMNIDGCRVGLADGESPSDLGGGTFRDSFGNGKEAAKTGHDAGRWPANVIHDGSDEIVGMFPESTGGAHPKKRNDTPNVAMSGRNYAREIPNRIEMGDSGSAARFFYAAKASRAERNAGLDGLPADKPAFGDDGGTYQGLSDSKQPQANVHPTVKPIALMRYLLRLVTPPNGTTLDPFAGSGTTLAAAIHEGFHAIGIELTPEYHTIIQARVEHAKNNKRGDSIGSN
jgi:site-specific DNA-methyltransferase (adenine-specific)